MIGPFLQFTINGASPFTEKSTPTEVYGILGRLQFVLLRGAFLIKTERVHVFESVYKNGYYVFVVLLIERYGIGYGRVQRRGRWYAFYHSDQSARIVVS